MKVSSDHSACCFFGFFKKPRVSTFFVVLAKSIFTPWSICSKKTKEQWKFVLKKGKVAKSVKSRKSSISSKSKSGISFSSKTDDKERVFAQQIMRKHSEFSVKKLDKTIERASKLADTILNTSYHLTQFHQIQKDLIEKNKKAKTKITERELLFKRCFKSLMELELGKTTDDFLVVAPAKSTKKLFGDHVFQIKSKDGKVAFYASQKELGSGSFNKAYFAYDLTLGKARVLRKSKQPLDNNGVAALKRENAIQQELRLYTDKVVKLYGEFYSNPFYGSILEFCNEGDINALKEAGKIKSATKKTLVTEVATFLKEIHANGFVYGDFKSDNLLIKNGKVKAGDFGGGFDTSTTASPGVATPYYIAPEIFDSRKTDKLTDLWALGIFLYEMKYTEGKKDKRTPDFLEKAFMAMDYFKKDDKKSVANARKIVQNGIRQPGKFLDLNDPYDKVIMALLKLAPDQRISAEAALEMLNKVPVKSFSK